MSTFQEIKFQSKSGSFTLVYTKRFFFLLFLIRLTIDVAQEKGSVK